MQSLQPYQSQRSEERKEFSSEDSLQVSSTAATKLILKGLAKELGTPWHAGARIILALDDHGYFLRYDIPPISLGDYLKSAARISQFYHGPEVGIDAYESSIGCHAEIILKKHLEQAEDDYEQILKEHPTWDRYPLQTEVGRNWEVALQRKFFPSSYEDKARKIRKAQKEGIEKIVKYWQKSGLFLNVFSPTLEESRRDLHYYPEWIACCDLIVLVYKPLESTETPENFHSPIFEVTPSNTTLQEVGRTYYANLNQPLTKRISHFFHRDSSPPSIKFEEVNVSENASPPSIQIEEVNESENSSDNPPSSLSGRIGFFLSQFLPTSENASSASTIESPHIYRRSRREESQLIPIPSELYCYTNYN